jgi:hypothetical protein
MVIALRRRDVDGIQMMIGRSLRRLNSSKTTGDVARRDENSRKRIRNVDEDSSAGLLGGRNRRAGLRCRIG